MQLKLIQVLRGLAALFVVLHHVSGATKEYFNTIWLQDVFRIGWSGVDFFFVLSGFIIVYIHLNDLKRRKNVIYFFSKRFIRLYPVYWILASTSLIFFYSTGNKMTAEGWDFEYILNSYLLLPHDKVPFLGVAWSLIFEVFFYFIFGISIMLGFRLIKFLIPIWFLTILLINSVSFEGLPFIVKFIFNGYIIEFLLGCLIGYLYHSSLDKFKYMRKYLLLLGLVLFVLMSIISFNTDFPR